MHFKSITALVITAFTAFNIVAAEANPNPVAEPAITPAPERRNAVVMEDKRQLESLIPGSLISQIVGGGGDVGSLVGSILTAVSSELGGLATVSPGVFSSLESQLSSLSGFSNINSIFSSVGINISIGGGATESVSSTESTSESSTSTSPSPSPSAAASTAASVTSPALASVSSKVSAAVSSASAVVSSAIASSKSSNAASTLPHGWGFAVTLVALGLGGGMLRFL